MDIAPDGHLMTCAELRTRPRGVGFTEYFQGVRAARDGHEQRASTSIRSANVAGRALTASEQRRVDAHHEEVRQLAALEQELADSPEGQHVDRSGVLATAGQPRDPTRSGPRQVLTREQRVADNVRPAPEEHRDLRFGPLLRGWLTGQWDNAEAEHRAVLSEGAAATGGVLVPSPLSTQLIDYARAASRCIQAGVQTVPMESQTLTVPRLAGTVTPAWRVENQQFAEGDLSFDSVKFEAKALGLIVKCSRELLEDGQDVDGTILRELASQVALEVDRVILRGSGTAPEPCGLRHAPGVTVTPLGANGGTPSWDTLVDQVQAIRALNYEPSAFIESPRTETTLAKQRENGTTGPYLAPPTMLQGIPRLTTNQVETDLDQGTGKNTSELYCGQWDRLWLGLRTQLQLGTLVERFAEFGQVAFILWLRADVQVVQPAAFNVATGVKA